MLVPEMDNKLCALPPLLCPAKAVYMRVFTCADKLTHCFLSVNTL